jgi:hypothetical protein
MSHCEQGKKSDKQGDKGHSKNSGNYIVSRGKEMRHKGVSKRSPHHE